MQHKYVSVTGDQKLEEIERHLRNSVGKQTKEGEMIDAWLELMEHAQEEDFYEKKYWAFLNGYLNLKMSQLLENELSIIETSVKMYIRELKLKNPSIEKMDEKMGLGKFLAELKDESDILVGFSIFLAEEFLTKNKSGQEQQDRADEIQPEGETDSNSNTILRQNIQKLQDKYGPDNKARFVIEEFQKDNQDLIANLLMDRSTDVMKAVVDSRKRDEQRDERRRAADAARRFEQE